MTPQHAVARAMANSVRMANGQLKRDIAASTPNDGAERVADLIEFGYADATVGAEYLDRLLVSIRYFGPEKVRKCLSTAGLAYGHYRLRELTPRQREAVVAQLRLWGAGYRA